jgi:protein TonB
MAETLGNNSDFSEDVHLQRLLAPTVEESWLRSLYRNVKDVINPPKLPPLQVTSRPVAVKDIWGGVYSRRRKSTLMSLRFTPEWLS